MNIIFFLKQKKFSLNYTLLFLFAFQLHAMEKNTPDMSVLTEIICQEIVLKLSNKYTNERFIKDQGENVFEEYKTSEGLNWSTYRYFSNNTIFFNGPEIVVQESEKYIHLVNIFYPLNLLATQIQIAQKVACVNKKGAQFLRLSIFAAKLSLAEFILTQTSYTTTISNMILYKKSNHFFMQPIHYVIARALGNAFSYGNSLKFKENHLEQIKFYIIRMLWASYFTYTNQSDFTQERDDSMPFDLPTNERLNIGILHLLSGMIQESAKNKKCKLHIKTFHDKKTDTITNMNYIHPTAQKMGLYLKIGFDSLNRNILTIEIAQLH